MKLTPTQQKAYWRLWTEACHAQGWTTRAGFSAAQIYAKRHECLRQCGVESMKHLTRREGYDAWKALCLRLADVLQGAIEEVDPEVAAMRRRVKYLKDRLGDLERMLGRREAWVYVGRIVDDGFPRLRSMTLAGMAQLAESCDAAECRRLTITVINRLRMFRRRAQAVAAAAEPMAEEVGV